MPVVLPVQMTMLQSHTALQIGAVQHVLSALRCSDSVERTHRYPAAKLTRYPQHIISLRSIHGGINITTMRPAGSVCFCMCSRRNRSRSRSSCSSSCSQCFHCLARAGCSCQSALFLGSPQVCKCVERSTKLDLHGPVVNLHFVYKATN